MTERRTPAPIVVILRSAVRRVSKDLQRYSAAASFASIFFEIAARHSSIG
jgi:hypothetical protein